MNKISRRLVTGILAVSVGTLGLTGCAPQSVDACAVSDEGSWNDNSFNEAVMDGLMKAKDELKVSVADAESNSSEDFATNLQAMVDQGCKLTFGVGFNLIDSVNKIATDNPTLNFVTIDGEVKAGQTNLKAVNYAMEQSTYLAGYLAASYSKTKVVGTYGGMNIPAVTAFMDGFYFGAKAYEKETGTAVTVVGWDPMAKTGDFMNDFTPNSGVSKTIAASQIQKGADVIMPVAGDQFGAVSEAIKDAGADAVMIGVDKNIAVTSPEYADYVLTSVEKRMTNAVFDIINAVKTGEGFSADPYVGTLANGGTGLSEFGSFDSKVSQETKDALKRLSDGIIDGSIDPKA